jgi:cell division protein ZapA
MAQVTIRINGYSYTLGCKDGEEKHLEAMAEDVNARIDVMRQAVGASSESRMLVLVALSMADEMYEMSKAAPRSEKRADSERIGRLAKRAEQIATSIDKAVPEA